MHIVTDVEEILHFKIDTSSLRVCICGAVLHFFLRVRWERGMRLPFPTWLGVRSSLNSNQIVDIVIVKIDV